MKALNDDEQAAVKALFKAGANGNITNKDSQKELNEAITSGNYEDARLLVNKAYKKKRMNIVYSASIVGVVTLIYFPIGLYIDHIVDPKNLNLWGGFALLSFFISFIAFLIAWKYYSNSDAYKRLEKIRQSNIQPTPSATPLTPIQEQKVVKGENAEPTTSHPTEQKNVGPGNE